MLLEARLPQRKLVRTVSRTQMGRNVVASFWLIYASARILRLLLLL